MIKIFTPSVNEIPAIIKLATETWIATYSNLISREQIDFMLAKFYDNDLLENQLKMSTHHFFAVSENDVLVAYAHCLEIADTFKLSKLYVEPSNQGKGLGELLMQELEKRAQLLSFRKLELCVNRGNPAQFFYEKMGFVVLREEDFPIGDYWMNDYVMGKKM
jgi:diamine N-acetyltransferase